MPKVLIADDEANILTLLNILFSELSMDVITAENGAIAVEKAKTHRPDLIITDVVMPEKNGFEVCRSIRHIPEIADTPIIILSALGDEYNKITGFDEGADDYLTKPFNVDELKSRAQTLLSRHQQKNLASAPPDPAATPTLAQPTSPKPSTGSDITQIQSGNSVIDQQLLGGLPQGSNILVVGPTGIGKSSFMRSFLAKGLDQQEPSLCIAIDDDPKKIRSKLNEQLQIPISDHEAQQRLRFVDAYSCTALGVESEEPFCLNGALELNQLAGVISDASFDLGQTIQDKKGGRRVIDSISSLFVNFELSAVQRFLTQIARTALAFGSVTTLFLLEEGSVSDQSINNIKYIMDGVIEFKEDEDQRWVRIASMKWTQSQKDWQPLSY